VCVCSKFELIFCWDDFNYAIFFNKTNKISRLSVYGSNFIQKQDIYGFLVKNLDLDSNLYNLIKRIKKLIKYYETNPNPKRP
jgi:hypothetical protein